MARIIKSNKTVSFGQIIAFIAVIILIIILSRMLLLVKERSRLAEMRRDTALSELEEVETLAAKLDSQAKWLESEEGQSKTLRDRYGIVSENEGYLILLHEHPEPITESADSWWQRWQGL